MLYNRRKWLRERDEREAAGETFWTKDFEPAVRNKIMFALGDNAGLLPREVMASARDVILRDEGRTFLHDPNVPSFLDFQLFFDYCESDDFAMVLEALVLALWTCMGQRYSVDPMGFIESVNIVLSEHRISFEILNNEMVPFESKEMHAAVVAPTLKLLSRRLGWEKVEEAYQNALREISESKPADAITDAATALQEALILRGAEGNSLAPLARSARRHGILGAHDSPMLDGIQKIVDAVNAARSELGDAHRVRDPDPEDAWLAVHVVGALILRLAART